MSAPLHTNSETTLSRETCKLAPGHKSEFKKGAIYIFGTSAILFKDIHFIHKFVTKNYFAYLQAKSSKMVNGAGGAATGPRTKLSILEKSPSLPSAMPSPLPGVLSSSPSPEAATGAPNNC